jgi:hypothetical protein
MIRFSRFAPILLFVIAGISAQTRVDPRYTYHRVIAVVPLVGAGTPQDPLRGKYVPTARAHGAPAIRRISMGWIMR